MTEKRFINHDDTILDNQSEQLISTDEIVDKLNTQHETIVEQRKLISIYKEKKEEVQQLLDIIDFILQDSETRHRVFKSRDEFFSYLEEKGVIK